MKRTRICVVQYAWGKEYQDQVDLTIKHTLRGCSKFGYSYQLHTHQPSTHAYWEKPIVILNLLHQGYDTVVWLDTDCLWLGKEPLHGLHDTVFGMTYHHICPQQTMMNHYNAGMIIVNDSFQAIELIEQWIETPDNNHQWHDQYSLNEVLRSSPSAVKKLDHRYNSVQGIPDYCSTDPVIVSWHGSPNRFLSMCNYIQSIQ